MATLGKAVVETAKEWYKAASWDRKQIPDLSGRTILVTGVRVRC